MERLLDNRSGKEVEPKTLLSVNRINDTLIFEFSAYDSSLNSFLISIMMNYRMET